jgi:hypothetical protein
VFEDEPFVAVRLHVPLETFCIWVRIVTVLPLCEAVRVMTAEDVAEVEPELALVVPDEPPVSFVLSKYCCLLAAFASVSACSCSSVGPDVAVWSSGIFIKSVVLVFSNMIRVMPITNKANRLSQISLERFDRW